MGKHNGKARSTGSKVGNALVNSAKKGTKSTGFDGHKHTTDIADGGTNMQSVIENNDLTELLTMADLADRDFTAERQQVVVISAGNNKALTAKDKERNALQRLAAEQRHEHRLKIPRRPAWQKDMSPEVLDQRERASFLEWRRDLAKLEDDEGLVLTPFEKNLEVWRQLWRVLERSDIVVQVLDARDPLRYRSEDLEGYASDMDPSKPSLLLLNKADLLPAQLRSAWADYFEQQHVDYVFWSAKAGIDALTAGPKPKEDLDDTRARVMDTDELIDFLQAKTQETVDKRLETSPDAYQSDRLTVGLTGYPNVGKSSTINALFGSKKTAVAPTPGKTKHFQTLNITEQLTLCDCPGLVLPRYAQSKSEMVAAGVIPIDRLTDVRTPIAVVCQRIAQAELERVYGVRLPQPQAYEPEDVSRLTEAAELLRSYALARGWVAAGGLPDETRSGRQILKDFVNGKLLHCEQPPGCTLSNAELGLQAQAMNSVPARQAASHASAAVLSGSSADTQAQPASSEDGATDSASDSAAESVDPTGPEADAEALQNDAEAGMNGHVTASAFELPLSAADRELMQSLSVEGQIDSKPKRPEYKFQKKAVRTKGNRGKAGDTETYDGAAFATGRRGGLVRVPVSK